MAKIKNKSRPRSEKANKKEVKKKLNPFEVHVNKEKLKVIGKRSKNDRGLPGISREKAINKRKHTLLQEYKLQNKSNKFIDKRIGEKNKSLSDEDKFIARYAKLRAKHEKKSRFNLADEVLTHRGQVLSEIEKFEDNCSDNDSDDELKGTLQSDFVEKAHFGGGIFEKGTTDGAKSHKDLIDQLIAESKKRKAEKQKLKEQTLELTEKLDSEWKDLIPLVNKKTKNDEINEIEKPKVDEFDKVMRELKFEARGHPSDRLKSEEEIAKEEKEKLEKLEEERLKRMHGFDNKKDNRRKHHGADDLDDNFEFEELNDAILSYDFEGKPNLKINAEINGKNLSENENINEEPNDDDENENNEDENNDGDEIDNENDDTDNENDDEDNENNENDEEDNFSDLKEESDASDEENEKLIDTENDKKSEIVSDLLKLKEIMEKAREELPYTFKLPKNYEELNDLLIKESPERQNVIIERMIKCNHPSLGASNKENLSTLFIYLIQYINDLSQLSQNNDENNKAFMKIDIVFKIFYNLLPHFYDLAHLNIEASHKSILEVMKEKQTEYRKKPKKYPGLEVLLFLKLIGSIFSTSDFKHSVVTPSFVFIDQMLNNCRIRTEQDVAYGLFLCTLVFEYTKLSKRFLPSAINFLSGLFYLSTPKTGIRILKICPPFKTSSNLLVLVNNHSEDDENDLDLKVSVENLKKSSNNDDFKMLSFYLSLNLIEEFINNVMELPSRYELLINVEKYLNLIPLNNYPVKIKKKAEDTMKLINQIKNDRNIEYLTVAKPRPKALRLYEPNIQKIYDGKRHKSQSKEKSETDKLIHKVRKERKGALREIRRDQAFLAKVKIKKQIQSDNERKEKVKRLYAEASIQQSELNAIDRKKKKK